MAAEIFTEPMKDYLEDLSLLGTGVHPVLAKMQEEGEKREFPIVGPEAGRFFLQIAVISQPKVVLDLGSGFGYSAMWWAMGSPDTHVICMEHDQVNIDKAKAYAEEAGVIDRMTFYPGEAFDNLHKIEPPIDIIFCDVDKIQYPAALDFALDVMRPGNVLIYDNMLWGGKILDPEDTRDETTRAIINTTYRIYQDHRFMTSMLPVRDGVLMAVRR
jgi:predicted O-methyltransferase YrrM